MGKISDVLDKYKKEKSIKVERIFPKVPESSSTLKTIVQKDINPKLEL